MRKLIFLLLFTFLIPVSVRVSADNGSYIVKFDKDISTVTDTSSFKLINKANNLYVAYDISQIHDLNEHIVYYEKNVPIKLIDSVPTVNLFTVPKDPAYPNQWQLSMINADYAWELETFGNDVNVAVIDSGCNAHTELSESLAGGYNYVSNNEDFSDNNGHGTHVAGIIGAKIDRTGIAGIAPEVNIYALKCADENESSEVDILATAIYDAVDKYNCRIINLSLGIDVDKNVIREAVEYAISKDVIIVASAGNDGENEEKADFVYYPAGYNGVIGVGSVGQTKEKSSFSQVNNTVFAVAPGERVISLSKNGTGYAYGGGTSQAAPHVTAVAAIMLSAKPDMTAAQFKEYIKTTSEDLGDSGYDTSYGYGLINVKAMFQKFFEERPYYVSPITNGKAIVYNGSGETLNAVGIWAEYENKQYAGGQILPISLLPDKKYETSIGQTENKAKLMLWSSMQNIYPLSIGRE